MSAFDRLAIGAIALLYGMIPLYGTFSVLDPSRPPIPVLVGVRAAIAIGLVALAAAGICTVAVVRRGAEGGLVRAQFFPGLAILLAAVLGFDPATGIKLAVIVAAIGAAGSALHAYEAVPGVTRIAAGAFVAGGAAACIVAIVMVLLQRPAAIYAYNNGRAIGTFLNSNELAAYTLLLIALTLSWAVVERGSRAGTAAAVVAAIGAAALALSYSRWGVLAAVCGVAGFAAWRRSRVAALAVVATAIVALAFTLVTNDSHHNPRDTTSRIVAWKTGLTTWAHFPLTGVGPFAFEKTYPVFHPPEAPGPTAPVAFDPHSMPLAYGAESGLVGFCGLIVITTIYVRAFRRAAVTAPPAAAIVATAMFAGIVALIVDGLVNTVSIFFALWLQGCALGLAVARNGFEPRAR